MRFRDCFTMDLRASAAKPILFSNICKGLILNPGYRAVVYYRIARYLIQIRFPRRLTNLLGNLLLVRICRIPVVEIGTKYEIGEGLKIHHPHDIVIGRGAIVGKNVTIYNGVTLGARNLEELDENKDTSERYPIIEDGVTIFSGSKLLGNITVGKNSIIGANSVVLDSFPRNSIIVGAPAQLIGKKA